MSNINKNSDQHYPLVSVFVPVYNAKDFIRECLDSIIQQDYPNLEIAVSDDASTDNTQQILQEYQAKYPHLIKLNLNIQNQGVSKNCNTTLKMCTGKYMAFFAGDDVMLPGKISAQVSFMEAHPECAICYHDTEVFYTDNSQKNFIMPCPRPLIEGTLEDVIEHYIKNGVFNWSLTNFAKREFIPPFKEDFLCSDLISYIEILERSKGTIRHIEGVYTRVRRHSNNVSDSKQMVLDEIATYAYLVARFPQCTLQVLRKCGRLYKINRHNKYYPGYYETFLWAGFRLDPDFRSLKRLMLYYLSFKKFKP